MKAARVLELRCALGLTLLNSGVVDRGTEIPSEALKSISGELVQMRQRKEKLECEIQKFMVAIAEHGHSKYMLEQIAAREKEIGAITDRLLASSPCGEAV